ncbi:hypothetical protein E4T38_03889 [Aureobasidium subglaciale]|nr:hypothetical protein E4T38_03889 [Aureobasidium subglaciale]KAI5225131.1 hypothetical protein E4T40_03664 [Aureobasidium subglaciale]KAI5228668.1 hypothetical protein E4T41_03729 [Aureobasidium subglaciale]KAI5263740.1 hypothetical protein E4T46_03505 [Aureobasidium subglaciale]
MSEVRHAAYIVPPGSSRPFAVVSDVDHSAWVIIATALGLSWSLTFGVMRVIVRATTRQRHGVDDYALAVSTFLTIIQSSIILGACANGLGKSITLLTPDEIEKVQQVGSCLSDTIKSEADLEKQMTYAGMLFWIIAIGASKLSVALFLLRLTPVCTHRRVYQTFMAILSIWIVVYVFAFALQCDMSRPWITIGASCPGVYERWQTFCALDIISEISLVCMTVYLVWDIQSSTSAKAKIVFAFSFRLPQIIAIAYRLKTFPTAGLLVNPTLSESELVVWTQTELNYSLMSATIPCLRTFVSSLSTNYGSIRNAKSSAAFNYESTIASRTQSEPSGQSFQMTTLNSVEQVQTSTHVPATLQEEEGYSYDIGGPTTHDTASVKAKEVVRLPSMQKDNESADRTSIGSNDSQRMIIQKEVTWTFERNKEW